MKRLFLFTAMAAAALPLSAQTLRTPTMGWSSWNTFALDINEDLIKGQADAIVANGLDSAGYQYVNIDDGYWEGRGADGKLILNTRRFPNGMRSLVDYIHSKGLKAGIYSDAGDNTCGSENKFPWGLGVGFAGHEEEDCNLYFNDWDFDFIKVDYCGGNHMKLDEREQYTRISNAIKNCGKGDVVFNVCRWAYPGIWISDIADSWRTTGDINCSWESVRSLVRDNLYIQAYTGGGHYNDMDMLEIGRTLPEEAENTHMAYWCITSSPLLIGCDMRSIPERSLALLKNRDLIAMNQDRLGIGAPVMQRQGEVYVVAKDMEQHHGPKRGVVVMNLSDDDATLPVDLRAAGFEGDVSVYDCLSHTPLGDNFSETFEVKVPAHGSRAYFLTGNRAEKSAYQAEEAYLPAYQELGKEPSPTWIEDPTADLGVCITGLGGSAANSLEWRDVWSKEGGDYKLTVRYATESPCDMTLSLDGKPMADFKQLTSGADTGKWEEATATVILKRGSNAIVLSNPTGPMPNIDSLTLTPLK